MEALQVWEVGVLESRVDVAFGRAVWLGNISLRALGAAVREGLVLGAGKRVGAFLVRLA
jgi:hypothetical protein